MIIQWHEKVLCHTLNAAFYMSHAERYILYIMQAVETQHAQQIKSLEKNLKEKMQELKETYQKVRNNLEYNDLANVIG